MESTSSATNPDYLFHELFDRYVRRVADKCDIPEITDQAVVINKVDLTSLSSVHQRGFEDWLSERFYIRIGIENALRRGMSVKALLTENKNANRTQYSVHIGGL